MPIVCIHCTLRAIVAGGVPPIHDETIAEHLARAHPDHAADMRERADLEVQAARILAARRNN